MCEVSAIDTPKCEFLEVTPPPPTHTLQTTPSYEGLTQHSHPSLSHL